MRRTFWLLYLTIYDAIIFVFPLLRQINHLRSFDKFYVAIANGKFFNQPKMSSSSSSVQGNGQGGAHQNVVVMRHGDRMDNFDPRWVTTAKRPWDPPLVDQGLARAFETGRILHEKVGFPIHRVFVSPFLRCIQTASQVISALCAVDDKTSQEIFIDPSKVKASIEFGLCEMLNTEAIRRDRAPKDGKFGFNISELEPLLPAGTIDHTTEPVYKELPKWEETVMGARARYEQIIKALADKYPSENLLLVTHGEGVGVSVSAFLEGATVYEVEYCAFSELRRPILFEDQSFKAGAFTLNGSNNVHYSLLSP